MTLYDDLDVTPDASTKEIERSYRKKAMKHHPDRDNGNSEEFKRASHAYKVLIDPVKRKQYDETGDDEQESRPIHVVLLAFFGKALNEVLSTGRDPSRLDLIKLVRNHISEARQQVQANEKEGLKRIRTLRTVMQRIKTKVEQNLLAASLLSQIKEFEQRAAKHQEQLEELKQCDEMLESYSYEHEKEDPKSATWPPSGYEKFVLESNWNGTKPQ